MDQEPVRTGEVGRLHLAVLDTEDLAVVSAHLQNAEAALADMAYLPKRKRFALVASRFDWTQVKCGRFQRCHTGLHFEHVLKVASTGLDLNATSDTRTLLAIAFKPENLPSGYVLLTFEDGGAIRLTVECLEAEMRDLGPRWSVDRQPAPPLDERTERV